MVEEKSPKKENKEKESKEEKTKEKSNLIWIILVILIACGIIVAILYFQINKEKPIKQIKNESLGNREPKEVNLEGEQSPESESELIEGESIFEVIENDAYLEDIDDNPLISEIEVVGEPNF